MPRCQVVFRPSRGPVGGPAVTRGIRGLGGDDRAARGRPERGRSPGRWAAIPRWADLVADRFGDPSRGPVGGPAVTRGIRGLGGDDRAARGRPERGRGRPAGFPLGPGYLLDGLPGDPHPRRGAQRLRPDRLRRCGGPSRIWPHPTWKNRYGRPAGFPLGPGYLLDGLPGDPHPRRGAQRLRPEGWPPAVAAQLVAGGLDHHRDHRLVGKTSDQGPDGRRAGPLGEVVAPARIVRTSEAGHRRWPRSWWPAGSTIIGITGSSARRRTKDLTALPPCPPPPVVIPDPPEPAAPPVPPAPNSPPFPPFPPAPKLCRPRRCRQFRTVRVAAVPAAAGGDPGPSRAGGAAGAAGSEQSAVPPVPPAPPVVTPAVKAPPPHPPSPAAPMSKPAFPPAPPTPPVVVAAPPTPPVPPASPAGAASGNACGESAAATPAEPSRADEQAGVPAVRAVLWGSVVSPNAISVHRCQRRFVRRGETSSAEASSPAAHQVAGHA